MFRHVGSFILGYEFIIIHYTNLDLWNPFRSMSQSVLILYIDYRQQNTMFGCLQKHISRDILLTTASTNGQVSGCSNIRPPATLNVTSSSIWCNLPSIRLENNVNEKHNFGKDLNRQYSHVYQAIYNLLWYVIEINLQQKISPTLFNLTSNHVNAVPRLRKDKMWVEG